MAEQVKRKYRKEAIGAVEEAERRGFENGRKAAEAAAAAAASSSATTKPTSLLIKEVQEMTYKDAKKRLANNEAGQDLLREVKAVLVASTTSLLRCLPDHIPPKPTPTPTPTPSRAQPAATQTAPVATSTTAPIATSTIAVLARPSVLRLRGSHQPPNYFIRVKVPCVQERITKGIIKSAVSYASYSIEVEIMELLYTTLSVRPIKTYQLERRYSEFKTLYSTLQKEFPMTGVPPLPVFTTSSPILSISGSGSGSNSNGNSNASNDPIDPALPLEPTRAVSMSKPSQSQKHKSRRRHVELWLQYLVGIMALQSSNDLLRFLTDHSAADVWTAGTIYTQPMTVDFSRVNSRDAFLFMKAFLPLHTRAATTATTNNNNINNNNNNNNTTNSNSGDHSNTTLSFREREKRRLINDRQDLKIIARDAMQLEWHAKFALDALHCLATHSSHLPGIMSSMGGLFADLAHMLALESNPASHKMLGVMATTVTSVIPLLQKIPQLLVDELGEYVI